jgi:chromosomal replication initiator protein
LLPSRPTSATQDPELSQAWSQVCVELREAVTDATFHIWLEPLRPHRLDGATLELTAPDEIRGWVSNRFARVIHQCAEKALGGGLEVRIVAPGSSPQAPAPRPAGRAGSRALAAPEPVAPEPPGGLNPKYSFDQFVIGESNRFAHAAALAVAEQPGHAYNPLFLYGPPGLGKTHLLHAIGNYVLEHGGGLSVRYVTVEQFMTEFVGALHHGGGTEAFKARYRTADVLLVDDVQFLERKAKTEDEFFHTFNALYETGSQLVLTSDRTPADLAGLDARLRERFGSGLVADVTGPDLHQRMTILRMRARQDQVPLADDRALDVIARRVTTNVRALEGALIRVVAFHSLTGRPLDAELATEVLDGLYPAPPSAPQTVKDVQAATCEAFGLSLTELVSPGRTARLAWPRQIAMYLSRELTDQTLPAIGRAFGNRNHSTVMHACQRTAERIAEDPDALRIVNDLTERLTARTSDRPR